jgi:hypothetical protein
LGRIVAMRHSVFLNEAELKIDFSGLTQSRIGSTGNREALNENMKVNFSSTE